MATTAVLILSVAMAVVDISMATGSVDITTTTNSPIVSSAIAESASITSTTAAPSTTTAAPTTTPKPEQQQESAGIFSIRTIDFSKKKEAVTPEPVNTCFSNDMCQSMPGICHRGTCITKTCSSDIICSCDQGVTGQFCDRNITEADKIDIRIVNGKIVSSKTDEKVGTETISAKETANITDRANNLNGSDTLNVNMTSSENQTLETNTTKLDGVTLLSNGSTVSNASNVEGLNITNANDSSTETVNTEKQHLKSKDVMSEANLNNIVVKTAVKVDKASSDNSKIGSDYSLTATENKTVDSTTNNKANININTNTNKSKAVGNRSIKNDNTKGPGSKADNKNVSENEVDSKTINKHNTQQSYNSNKGTKDVQQQNSSKTNTATKVVQPVKKNTEFKAMLSRGPKPLSRTQNNGIVSTPITNRAKPQGKAKPKHTGQNQKNVPTKPKQTGQNQKPVPTKPKQTQQNQKSVPTKPKQTQQNQKSVPTKPKQTQQNQNSVPTKPKQTEQNQKSVPIKTKQTEQNHKPVPTNPKQSQQNQKSVPTKLKQTEQNQKSVPTNPKQTQQNQKSVPTKPRQTRQKQKSASKTKEGSVGKQGSSQPKDNQSNKKTTNINVTLPPEIKNKPRAVNVGKKSVVKTQEKGASQGQVSGTVAPVNVIDKTNQDSVVDVNKEVLTGRALFDNKEVMITIEKTPEPSEPKTANSHTISDVKVLNPSAQDVKKGTKPSNIREINLNKDTIQHMFEGLASSANNASSSEPASKNAGLTNVNSGAGKETVNAMGEPINPTAAKSVNTTEINPLQQLLNIIGSREFVDHVSAVKIEIITKTNSTAEKHSMTHVNNQENVHGTSVDGSTNIVDGTVMIKEQSASP